MVLPVAARQGWLCRALLLLLAGHLVGMVLSMPVDGSDKDTGVSVTGSDEGSTALSQSPGAASGPSENLPEVDMPVVDQPSVEGPVADPSPPAEPLNLKSALQQVASFASYPRKDRDLFYWSDRHSFNLRTWFIPRSVMEIFRKAEVDKVISVINWEYIISEKNTLEYSTSLGCQKDS
ncbi:hypothetical protein CXG81DRAFT_20069 [Caulochytrium protostelioides]|uniref:Uncharacterized protein n=1 Tax=Caulochytrium protostelioides TaxID=1555241 RepID=A0A4P9X4F0_9FUNG|nr:hypothetical protein CXG81DRAFT_20069 [Caulochytrium protostelioides]|eukprot:RKO99911.1 hypothetical protein CXG81DRAFT_20069 [Caulochytrium protostelioides]